MAEERKLIPIRFVQKQSPYNAGEVAGFETHIARQYVDAQLAEFYDPEEVVRARGEEVVQSVGREERSVSENAAEKATANDAPQVLAPTETSPAGKTEEDAGEPENPAAGSRKSDKEKDLKGPLADRMVRGSPREK
jgi:hypothetical protein